MDDLARLQKPEWSEGTCACGAVQFAIKHPARWAWHDHSKKSRHIHGAPCATYVGTWRKRFRFDKGEESLLQWRDDDNGVTRRFCGVCGTPVLYERDKSPHMINIPRALFLEEVGREPRYHGSYREIPDWAYLGEKVSPLKDYPSFMYERPRKKTRQTHDTMFDFDEPS